MKKINSKSYLKKIFLYLILVVICIYFIFPIYWSLITAFKHPADIYSWPPKFIFKPTLINWRYIWYDWELSRFLINSLIVTSITLIIAIPIGSLAGYSFSRFKFKGRESLLMDILSLRMVPPIVGLIPLFIIAKNLNLLNTYVILIIIYVTFNLPLIIWISKSFFDDLPIEVEEAALIDGCDKLSAFIRVVLPMARSSIIAIVIITAIFVWNEFMFANILTGFETRTLPVIAGMSVRQRSIEWGPAAMLALIIALPIVILTLIIQKYLVTGLTFGAVKG